MQHFQSILIAIGILAIAGVLIHGFLLNRKNKLALLAEQEEHLDELDTQDKSNLNDDKEKVSSFNRDFDAMAFSTHLSEEKEDPEVFDFQVEQEITDTKQQKQSEIADIELQKQTEITDLSDVDLLDSTDTPSPAIETPVEIFIFNISAKKDQRLGGHELLQFFLTSGFRYGEMDIFHRHEHSDGTGEILFSIANMMAPGTFDIDYMEQFNSPGISFFFTAPNAKISVNKSFDMMLRAVEQAAEEFDCEVLDEKREKFTPEKFIEYRTRLAKYP